MDLVDRFMHLLEITLTSPWVYVVIITVALLDAFVPVIPSETVVIASGVFTASLGSPNLVGVIVAATAGAFVGDHISYALGRAVTVPRAAWMNRGKRRRAAFTWARRAVALRGGLLLVVARFVPGGRTAMTITMGAVGFPLRRFAAFDLVAAGSWATYAGLVGYVGGAAFEEEPIKGLAVGIGLALGIVALIEGARQLRARRERTTPASAPDPTGDPEEVASPSAARR